MPTIQVIQQGSPLTTHQGVIGFCSVVLVEGQKRTLVDCGHIGRRTNLLESLQTRGLSPETIDVLVLTHAHWDHNQNVDLFYGKPLLIHASERRYAHRPHHNDWATPQWTGAMLEHRTSIQEVGEGYEVEPGVWIMETPGHSPGSIAVMVETDNGLCCISGDTLHYANVALSHKNPLVFWNEEQAAKSIQRIVEIADVVYPGHDRPFRLVKGEIEYLAPVDITIKGIAPGMPGVEFDPSPRIPWVMPGIEEQSLDTLR